MNGPKILPDEDAGAKIPLYDQDARFSRMARLVGSSGVQRLATANVMVIGLGGVGSWAAEALARSGVGHLTIVDFDLVCIRNFNRQLGAVEGQLGKPKALAMADRLRLINPQAEINPIVNFASPDTIPALLAQGKPELVIDAIDHVTSKCFLIHYCWSQHLPIIVATGSAGRLDPTQVRIGDLAETQQDPLAKVVRRVLRQKYNFPRQGKFNIPAVYALGKSLEPVGEEPPCSFAGCPQAVHALQSCTQQRTVRGSASFVTGAFGLACAALAVQHLLGRSDLSTGE